MPFKFEAISSIAQSETKDKKSQSSKSPSLTFEETKKLAEENERKRNEKQTILMAEKGYGKNKCIANKELPKSCQDVLSYIDDYLAHEDEKERLYLEKEAGRQEKIDEYNIQNAQWIVDIIKMIKENEDSPDVVELFWREFNNKFQEKSTKENDERKNYIKNSVLGTLATEKILKENLKVSDFEITTPKIDVKYDIDAWIETKNKENEKIKIAVQLLSKSCDNLSAQDKKFLLNKGMSLFFNEDDLYEKWERFADTPFAKEMEEKIRKTKEGCKKYIENYEKELMDAKFILIFATMPVGIEKRKKIVNNIGKPLNKKIIDQFCKQYKYGFDRKANNIKIL